jgi:hypothetical protein
MNDFLNNISSIYWWISVVVVGIAINLVSHYLLKRLDAQFSKSSIWWKKISDKQKQERLQKIEGLRNDPQEVILESFSELRYRLMTIMFSVFSVIFFSFTILIEVSKNSFFTENQSLIRILQLFLMAMAILAISTGAASFQAAANSANLIISARKRNENQEKPNNLLL